MENKWESYGDVNPLEHGGVWVRQDKDDKNCFTVITLDLYDEEDGTYQFTNSYIDITDSWIDWEAVSGFAGENRQKYASDVVSYLQTKAWEEVKSCRIETERANSYSYCNVMYDGQRIAVLNMPNAGTIDLNEINCPPWTHLPDGRLVNIAYSLVLDVRCPTGPVVHKES